MNDFHLLIADWYRLNQRSLPWRQTSNPYLIWLSEIILQQTRVDQGISYYKKFAKNYPTVTDLANAEEIDLLNDWQGLGYYSRARNLHFSAKLIRDEYDAKFPSTYSEILKLKGVGKYTAAAIASMAFNENRAVVDGNVYRVLSRVFDMDTPIDSTTGAKEFQALADELIDPNNPGDHNQAIMELGATVCTPKPKCDECPLNQQCIGLQQQNFADRPVKAKKTKVRDRYFHYMIYSDGKRTILEKRETKDIWQNMFQFPLYETTSLANDEIGELVKNQKHESVEIVHILSHQKIHAKFHHFQFLPETQPENWIKAEHADIQNYPLPRIIDRYLEKNKID
jgi:A/G-specific adenine glycosylase